MRNKPIALRGAGPVAGDRFFRMPEETPPRVDAVPSVVGLLRGFGARLRRRGGWFALAAGLGLAGVGGAFVLLPRTYVGTAKVIIAGGDELMLAGPNAPQSARAVDTAEVESQVQQLRSSELLGQVLGQPAFRALLEAECEIAREAPAARLRARVLPFRQSCAELSANGTEAVERLDSALRIGTSGRSRVIEVSYSSASAEAAAAVPNMLVETFIARDRARRVEPREAAVSWLSAEAERLAAELQSAERAVAAARRDNGILRGREAAISAEQLSAMSAQLSAAQAERAQLASRLALQPNAMMIRRGYEEASARVEGLTRDFARLSAVVNDQNAVEVTVAAMLRSVEAKREVYVNLSNRASELEVQRRLVGGSAQLLSGALVPTRPASPSTVRLLGGGVLLAIVFGMAVALMRDAVDGTVRSASRLARLTGLPVLGIVPRSRLTRRRLRDDRWLRQPSMLQEAMRAMLGRVMLRRRDPSGVMLLASSDPGEGKSFLSLALARYAAHSGRRVLLVECDLRKPGLRGDLGLPRSVGLSEVLRGEAEPADAILATPHERLDVMPAGRAAHDSLELLSGPRLNALLDGARERYDLVLLDGPPVGALVDACVLARAADGVLFCAAWGRSRPERILDALSSLTEAGGRITGLVVNRASRSAYPLYEADVPFAAGPRVARLAGAG